MALGWPNVSYYLQGIEPSSRPEGMEGKVVGILLGSKLACVIYLGKSVFYNLRLS